MAKTSHSIGQPRVTHFNDCADVGLRLVEAAARKGLTWNYLPPDEVRPAGGFGSSPAARLAQVPFVVRHWRMLRTSDVVHIHYATAQHLLQHGFLPARPYVLHLHGSDIRVQWKEPATHDLIQRAIDGAHTVFYANLDNQADATTARSDAQYMPAPMDLRVLPEWRPSQSKRRRIAFSSRWDGSKGVEVQLRLAERLRQVHGDGVEIVGLDWGPGAWAAAALGVRLVPKMPHVEYVNWLASADLVIGQASGILAVSELEAMAIGPVVACPVESEFIDPGAPVIRGPLEQIVDASVEVLEDPRASSAKLDARSWVASHHGADQRVPMLQEIYRDAAGF